ncbi:MAG: signal peptidase I [Candidatus Woesearchaeota archaeon]
MNFKETAKKVWNFVWYEDSFLSLLANIVIAFILIKYMVYPGLGLVFGTSLPLVAVVSSSMHHEGNFEQWWMNAQSQYEPRGITESQFMQFPLINGFDKGDIMLIYGATTENLKIGDIVIFDSNRPNPIIHRVIKMYEENGKVYYQTKGDNYQTNPDSIKSSSLDETKVPIEKIQGKALFRLPFLGYVKILAVEFVSLFQ